MDLMPALVFGILGLIVGSFLNVLILRWGTHPLTGRSRCPACRTEIAWYDLVPILSWLALRGRCRSCSARISFRYPLVEGATGLIFIVISAAPLSLYAQLLALPIAALLIAIAVYDFDTTYIPDAWVWTFNALTLLALIFNFQFSIFNLAAGFAVALPLFALWFVSRGRWMGFGDVKLALGIGWLLGIVSGFAALLLSFILGALIGVPLLFFSSPAGGRILEWITPKRESLSRNFAYTMKSEIPFGPFLVLACIIVWILDMYGTDTLSRVAGALRLLNLSL